MKNSSRFILIILLLLFSWWLQNLLDRKPELITREKARFANYYLQDFKLTAHDKEGKIKYILQAQRLDNYEKESLAEIKSIRAEFINKEGNWTISADNATLYRNNKSIEFLDNVLLSRPGSLNQAALTLQTDKITLFTEQEKLESNSHIRIKSGETIIESNGISYDSKQGILELKANVKAVYVK